MIHSKSVKAGLVLAALLLPLLATAAEWKTGEQFSLGSSERYTDDLYIAGGNVTTAATINGDLAAMGGNVLVNGPVSGDIFAAGGSVTILGSVGDDLRVAGGNITISSAVRGDLVVGGGQVNISGEGIGGDVLAGTGVLRIDAPVGGDVVIGGGEVVINAPVGGNVRFAGENLTLGSGAVIEGNLSYASPKEAKLEEGAVVRGETSYEQTQDVRGIAEKGFLAFITLATIGKFLSILASALIIGLAFSKYSVALVEGAIARPWFEMGRGLVTLILLPVFSIILLVTVLGIPLGLLGLTAFVAAIIFSSLVAPIILGSLSYKWITRTGYLEVSWKTILLGVVLYTLIGLVPFIGPLVKFALVLLALGVTAKIKWDIAKSWQ
ncbi:MAG: hypothetical protein HYS26_02570 [Candidatus Kaiserbacteria bacterium]|nr:MAG: hypothetical protein HYS26_02570 [Candidatus Kaiserbacteria bacterium]